MPVYELMRKNERVTLMALNQSGGIEKCDYKNINRRIAPLQEQICVDGIQRWWGKRAVPLNQGKIKHILEQQGIFYPEEYLVKNLGLSLTDYYWIRPIDSGLTWEMVNLYQNDFCGSLELEDRITSGRKPLSTYTPDSTLQGELEKSWIILENKRYLVKGNRDYLSAESINEVFASYLHQKQGYDNYSGYTLLKIKGAAYDYGCCTEAFTSEQKEFVSAYAVITSEKQKNDSSTYEHFIHVCEQHGIDAGQLRYDLEYQIMSDFIISNVDRHLNNVGILRDADSLCFERMAPIFDSGKSLFVSEAVPTDKELLKIKTASFTGTELGLLKYVKDRSLVDVVKLPTAQKLWELYHKDSKMDEKRIELICERYEKKVELFQRWQNGQDLNPRKSYNRGIERSARVQNKELQIEEEEELER